VGAAAVRRCGDDRGRARLLGFFPWVHLLCGQLAHEPLEVSMSKQMELTHLTREIKTGLELAIAALAPSDLVDRLATAAGLLDAITDMALDEVVTIPLVVRTTERANQALTTWRKWREDHPPKATA
jgi:hypothetical protein